MKLKKMPKDEIEMMSYTDLTYHLLKENKEAMTTPDIFKHICDLLDYNNEQYETGIGDYYTSLTMDKRFVLLDNGKWDIRDHHSIELDYDDEEDDFSEESNDEEESEEENEEESEDIDEETDEDLGDLVIVEEEDIDE